MLYIYGSSHGKGYNHGGLRQSHSGKGTKVLGAQRSM